MRRRNKEIHVVHGSSRLSLCLLWFPIFCFNQIIVAQEIEDFDLWDEITHSEEFLHSTDPQDSYFDKNNWHVSLGMVGGSAPEYRGSNRNELGFAPLLRVIWKDLIFLKSRKFGVNVFDDDVNTAGAFIRYKGGRSSDNDGLEGLDKIRKTATVGFFYNRKFNNFRFKSEINQDALGHGHGTVIDASLSSRFPKKQPLFSISLGTTWASDEHMDTYYGVDARQSLNSGLRQFDSSSGFRDVWIGLGTRYRFSNQTAISVHIQYLRLLDDAANSPIVKDIGSADQFVAGIGLSYTFN